MFLWVKHANCPCVHIAHSFKLVDLLSAFSLSSQKGSCGTIGTPPQYQANQQMVIEVQEMQVFLFQIIYFPRTCNTMSYFSITSLGKHWFLCCQPFGLLALVPRLHRICYCAVSQLIPSQLFVERNHFLSGRIPLHLSQKRCIRRLHFQERKQVLNDIPQLPRKGLQQQQKDKL